MKLVPVYMLGGVCPSNDSQPSNGFIICAIPKFKQPLEQGPGTRETSEIDVKRRGKIRLIFWENKLAEAVLFWDVVLFLHVYRSEKSPSPLNGKKRDIFLC